MSFQVEVRIELKPGVIDAEGETVKKSLQLLGYGAENVKTVKVYVIEVEAKTEEEAREKMEDACRKLLANPVIQDYRICVKNA